MKQDQNKKTITLRLDESVYEQFFSLAKQQNRSISNLIETLATNKLQEDMFTDDFETSEILSNQELLKSLRRGSKEAKLKKGRFAE